MKKSKSNLKKHTRHFVGFALSSITGFAINILVLYLLTDFTHLYYILSAIVAFLVSHLYSYNFNDKITFQKEGNSFTRWLNFLASNIIAMLVNLALLYYFTEYTHIYYLISQTIASIITFFINFFLSKYWVFK